MRTPLACRLRVMISPWKSLPIFLKVPMVAMSLLLLWFRVRDHRGSMAIDRPRTIGDAPARRPERSVGRRRETFLPREEWALAQGKKVLSDGVAARTIEAQPVFGQIKPSKRPGASARRTAISGNDLADLGCATQEAETFRRRERKYLQQMVVLSAEYQPRAKGPTMYLVG